MMSDSADFFASSRDAKKVLVIDIPALGDTVHLLPALHLIRQNYPQAELHVMAGDPGFYAALVPWVDRCWPPVRRPFLKNLSLIGQLRREHFDAVIVITSHNRMVLIANMIGARWRLGRHTDEKKPWWWQPLLYTHTVNYPFHQELMYLQRWRMLKQCGLQGEAPEFHVALQPQWFGECGLTPDDRKTYLHVSPYYSFAGKELPVAQYVDLLTRLHALCPRIVLSCAPPKRECELLQNLVAQLPFTPFRMYPGTLSIYQYIALVDGARVHLGGDSGGLHVARMVGTPSVSWYRARVDYRNWAPAPLEPDHRLVLTEDISEDACRSISTDAVLAAAADLLRPGG